MLNHFKSCLIKDIDLNLLYRNECNMTYLDLIRDKLEILYTSIRYANWIFSQYDLKIKNTF